MKKTIMLTKNSPRDIASVSKQARLNKGILAYFIFGYFFMLTIIIPIIFIAMIPGEKNIPFGGLIVSILFFEGIGIMLLFTGKKKLGKRIDSIRNGIVIKAKVISQSREFVFWKSVRDFSVILEIEEQSGKVYNTKIQSGNWQFHNELPIGSSLYGLKNPKTGSVFFPAEIGLKMEIEDS